MNKKYLKNVEKINMWNSFMGAVKSVLKYKSFDDISNFELLGISGRAFDFVIGTKCDAGGVTVYDWGSEHFHQLDRVGIYSDFKLNFNNDLNTYRYLQNDCISLIKNYIDKDTPVIIWAPTDILEFGIINGYDDEDEVFFAKDVANDDPDPLLYKNLGFSLVPYLYICFIKDFIKIDNEKAYRTSLAYGVREWNKKFHISKYYSKGLKAYDNLMFSIKEGDFDRFGFKYCLSVYNESKRAIYDYLNYLREKSSSLNISSEVIEIFLEVSSIFSELVLEYPFLGHNDYYIIENKDSLIKKFERLKYIENEGFKILKDDVLKM
jgi:hypothetical protein